MTQAMRRTLLILAISNVLMAGSCGTLGPTSVEGLRTAVGDALPGAKGKTRDDQIKIDRTVARLCAANVYERGKCDEHTVASAARWGELSQDEGQ
mgnify:CR=1 FL=1